MSATMKGDFNGKRGRISEITCHNGEFFLKGDDVGVYSFRVDRQRGNA